MSAARSTAGGVARVAPLSGSAAVAAACVASLHVGAEPDHTLTDDWCQRDTLALIAVVRAPSATPTDVLRKVLLLATRYRFLADGYELPVWDGRLLEAIGEEAAAMLHSMKGGAS